MTVPRYIDPSTLAYEFATYLTSNGFGTLGVTVYAHGFPPEPDTLVAVLCQGGPSVQADDPISRSRVQILIRDPDVRSGLGTAIRLFELIQGRFVELTHAVLRFEADAPPGAYYRDEQNRAVHSVNYLTTGRPQEG